MGLTAPGARRRSNQVDVAESGVFRRTQTGGDYFGEIALLHDVPRTATVVATSPLRVIVLDRDEFLAAIGSHPRATHEMSTVATVRLGR